MKQASDEERQAIWETLLFYSNRGLNSRPQEAGDAAASYKHELLPDPAADQGGVPASRAEANAPFAHRQADKEDRLKFCVQHVHKAADGRQSLQSQTLPRNVKELIEEVHLAFEATKATKLNRTLVTLQLMMQHIMRRGGSNDFRLTHFKKDHLLREGRLSSSLSCDSQLYFDTLAAPVRLRLPYVIVLVDLSTSVTANNNEAELCAIFFHSVA
ncbi:unnamed protein product [Phytophthora lilii]|uniref:Unnamed protein product n=1 Tax=Phytophthora lilii TaxID=2077276 RepID=A0A9W6TIF9_9STRA|nr:unnamed protein product [Phytophthora lilii]